MFVTGFSIYRYSDMKLVKSTFIVVFLFFSIFINAGCGDKDINEDNYNFHLVTTGLSFNGSKNDFKINVPFNSKTYTFKVEADAQVKWRVSITEGSILTVTPEGEQSGDGEFCVTVASNDENETGRKGVVTVRNSVNSQDITITFIQIEKQLYIPDGLEGQRQEDFYKESTQWNINYMLEGDDIAILWDKAFGKNPKYDCTVINRRFDPEALMDVAEQAYFFMRNKLGFASNSNTIADRYKFLVIVKYDDNGAASGGGVDVNNGPDGLTGLPILWIRPLHLNTQSPTYNVIYHEMSHSFQVLCMYDGAYNLMKVSDGNGIGSFYEMTSQWTLLRHSPNWMELEPTPFEEFIARTHYTLGHSELQYRNPYILEYWATKHGVDIISKIWQNATEEDLGDFIRAYMRITETDQETFNAEIFDAATRFITWDLPHIDKEYNRCGGANVHTCILKKSGSIYKISNERCPQNYGYNGISLKDFVPGQNVTVKFKGLPNETGYNIKRSENAEWRWGFVASLEDGKRVYSESECGKEGNLTFTVPENTRFLWLVVAATPMEYWFEFDNEWPYQFEITGAVPDGDKCKVN